MKLVLASSSPYRRELLEKLGLSFETHAPDIDEEGLQRRLESENKTPKEIAEALSFEKANKVALARMQDDELIIAGDQLVSFKNRILGKAGSLAGAALQLQELRGKTHELITSMTLLSKDRLESHTNVTRLKMKSLSDPEIQKYVERDQVTYCAGSYKIEKSGIALFEAIECEDFSAIQGIPLIWLSNRLKEYGYEFFNFPAR